MRGKNWAAVVLLGTVVLLGACGAAVPASADLAPGSAQAAGLGQSVLPISSGYTPGLTVVGTGTVEADPDIVYIVLGLDLKADNAATVTADAGARMERILAALKAAGIADADIRTVSYNLWVEQVYDPITGRATGQIDYRVMHSVRVTVRDLEKVGEILSTAVEAGANTVQGVTFSVADPDKLASEARGKAIADAQKRAGEMADAMGVRLGKVVVVSESGGYVPMPVSYDTYGRGAAAMEAAVPLPAGSFSVSISVVVVYELP